MLAAGYSNPVPPAAASPRDKAAPPPARPHPPRQGRSPGPGPGKPQRIREPI